MGFTKLDSGIVHSSVWSESLATRVLWVTMLAMADSKGFVSSSRSGLLRAANIPESDFDTALNILESPDPDSRSPEHDGKRIQKCEGGWMVLNYIRYREFTYSGSPEAVKKRKQRDKKGHKGDMSPNGGDISASVYASKYASESDLQEQIKKRTEIIVAVVSYLNEKAGKKFSPKASEAVKHIGGRISEGRTLDDFKRVIDVKVAKWKGKSWKDGRPGRAGEIVQGDDLLRPKTLFASGNFENYVNESLPKEPNAEPDKYAHLGTICEDPESKKS